MSKQFKSFVTDRFLLVAVSLVTLASIVKAAEDKPTVAIDGYDTVAYFTDNEAKKGDPAFQVTYLDKVYYFASEDAKKKFEADPEKYLPQFNGLCTTALGGTYGNRLPSDPTVFEVREGKLYLFSQPRAKAAYDKNPQQFIEEGNKRFNKPAIGGHCVVTSQKEGKPVKGDPKHQAIYRNFVYHFASAGAVAEFRKNPTQYLPQYDNYCAAGMARGKAFPADGERLRVYNGKTYMLFDADAEKQFDADPAGMVAKADAEWPKVKAEKEAEKEKSKQPKRP